jgi:hypothetical protein
LLYVSGLAGAYFLGLDALLLGAVPERQRARVLTVNTAGLMALQGIGFAAAGLVGQALAVNWVVAGFAGLGLVAVVLLRPGGVRSRAVPGEPSRTSGGRSSQEAPA